MGKDGMNRNPKSHTTRKNCLNDILCYLFYLREYERLKLQYNRHKINRMPYDKSEKMR